MKPEGLSEAIDLQAGHRQRLRERFNTAGAQALADYELLEMVLFRAIRRSDTKPIAKMLIARFGSFAEVISAPRERLMEIKGVGEVAADELKLVQAAALRLAKGEMIKRKNLSTASAILDYCRSAMAFEEREQFRLIFLDKKNNLIADEVQQQGTIDHTPVYIREVVKRSLELGASALILLHNHPSGDPTPSIADIEMTKKIIVAAEKVSIMVHDHLIIGRNGHVSLCSLGVL